MKRIAEKLKRTRVRVGRWRGKGNEGQREEREG
jgi:hypothetical protein